MILDDRYIHRHKDPRARVALFDSPQNVRISAARDTEVAHAPDLEASVTQPFDKPLSR